LKKAHFADFLTGVLILRKCLILCFLLLCAEKVCADPGAVDCKEEAGCLDSNIELLEGISLLGRDSEKGIESFQKGIHIHLSLPGSKLKLIRALTPFLQKKLDSQLREQIKMEVYHFFQKAGRPFIFIHQPKSGCAGFLRLVVLESTLARITIEGNRWSSDEKIRKWLSLSEGKPIDESRLMQAIQFINKNPSRRALAIYSPGQEHLTTDVKIRIEEKRPIQVQASTANTGVKYLEEGVSVLSLAWTDAFRLGNLLAYQFAASNNFKSLQSHSLVYTAYFNNLTWLSFLTRVSTVRPDLKKAASKMSGMSGHASLDYHLPISFSDYLSFEASFGLDYKMMNQVLEYGAINSEMKRELVDVSTGSLGLSMHFKTESQTVRTECKLVGSPARWLPNQSDAQYSAMAQGAKALFAILKIKAEWERSFINRLQLFASLKGQFASGTLLPSEQIGIGGADSVRGYRERELNRDDGAILSAEIRSQPIRMPFRKNHYLTGLIFMDYGWGSNHQSGSGFYDLNYLWGAGPAIRYYIGTMLAISLDWGWRLNRSAHFRNQNQMISYSFSLSF
jgi:hemolysin activation/secretion protein